MSRRTIPRGLGPGHDTRRCSVCREQRRAVVDVGLVIALVCVVVLVLAAWFLPPGA